MLAHSAAGPIGSDQVAANDLQGFAAFTVNQCGNDPVLLLFTAPPFQALAQSDLFVLREGLFQNVFKRGLGDIDQWPLRKRAYGFVLAFIGQATDLCPNQGGDHPHACAFMPGRGRGMQRIHRQSGCCAYF